MSKNLSGYALKGAGQYGVYGGLVNFGLLKWPGLIPGAEKKRMEDAYKEGALDRINEVERSFLASLSLEENFEAACSATGVSPTNGKLIMSKLLTHGLVALSEDGNGYCVCPAAAERLKEFSRHRRVFGSGKAKEVYLLLSMYYDRVYPEILLSSIIEYDAVKELLESKWQENYFYRARVDFVICSIYGVPVEAIEYDGGYHGASRKQLEKDRLKETLLKAAGLKLKRYTGFDLKRLKEAAGDPRRDPLP